MVLRSEILQTLHASLPSGAAGYGTFRSRLRAIPREAARSLVLDFLQQYLDTGFDDDTWVALTGQGASPLIRTQQIRKIWDALVREDWAPESIERSLSTGDGIERWAWLPRWSLLSQDEDLMLWGFAPELLHAARQGGLRQVQFTRGAAEAAQVGHGHEGLHAVEVDLHVCAPFRQWRRSSSKCKVPPVQSGAAGSWVNGAKR